MDTDLDTLLEAGSHTRRDDPPTWTVLSDASRAAQDDPTPISRRRVLAVVVLGTLAVLVLVAVSGSLAASRLAAKESVNDAAKNAALLAEAVVQPALTDRLASGDPEAFALMDKAVREHVLGPSSVRVKIWSPQGKIVYSDEPALVGKKYALGEDERDVFAHPVTRAEISDLSGPENVYERGRGKLLEVYRPVWTPSGDPLLFETYAPYDSVIIRSQELWRGFVGITLSSLFALIGLMVPLVLRLLARVRQDQEQREQLLQRAVDASTDERRRIAGNLHDGVIQDLAGASLVVSSAARSAALEQPELAAELRNAAATVRRGITGMRTLLVDIYPPNLETAGLLVALEDHVTSMGARDIDVTLDLDPDAVDRLTPDQERLFYRIAHECLLNTMRHAQAGHVTVTLGAEDDATVLEIIDDGVGFEPTDALLHPEEGHFGLRVLANLAREAGADLRVASAPGKGTHWYVRDPALAASSH